MSDTLPSPLWDPADKAAPVILGPVGEDTLFGGEDWPEEEEADTETIIYGGKLWRIAYVGAEHVDPLGQPRRRVTIIPV